MKVKIGKFPKNGNANRKIDIQIDGADTWSLDHTLAHIILPMLKQLRDDKHGSPMVDDDDVPEYLRAVKKKKTRKSVGDLGHSVHAVQIDDEPNTFHSKWDWVLNEMIWAFEQELDDDWEAQFHHGKPEYLKEEVEHDKYGTVYTFKQTNPDYWVDREGIKAYNERINNGMRLFGKYYRGLWD